jgi:hypothetical protein
VHQLSALQIAAYADVATSAGWDPLPQIEDDNGHSIADALRGKLVGIYTLTERAARQAETALKRIAPEVKVRISSDKVCTTQLTTLSQNADYMIVTTSSAKHAATDCIRAQREVERILFAAGRGCGSILKALEDYLYEYQRVETH